MTHSLEADVLALSDVMLRSLSCVFSHDSNPLLVGAIVMQIGFLRLPALPNAARKKTDEEKQFITKL